MSGLTKQQQPWPANHACWPYTPRYRCNNPVCSVLCSFAASHRLSIPAKNAGWTLFTCKDRVPNKNAPNQAGILCMFALLTQCHLPWLRHIRWMEDRRILKESMYGELTSGSRLARRAILRYKEVTRMRHERRLHKSSRLGGTGWRLQGLEAYVRRNKVLREQQWEERRESRQ